MDEKEDPGLYLDNFVKALESWIEKLEKIERKLKDRTEQQTRSPT